MKLRILKSLAAGFALLACLVMIPSALHAQGDFKQPVTWSYKVVDAGNGEADLVISAKIDKDWHLYSQFNKPGGPLPTELKYTPLSSYQLVGKTKESPRPKDEYEAVFEMNIKYWIDRANFTQRIKVLSEKEFAVEVRISYMVCNNGSCVALDNTLKIPVKGIKPASGAVEVPVDTATAQTDTLAKTDTLAAAPGGLPVDTSFNSQFLKGQSVDGGIQGMSLWWIFIMGFLGGLLALITPCVWPMIPLTVSFFLKRSENKRKGRRDAITYGIGIIVIYVLLGLGVTLIFGADALNSLSTHPGFNVFFFLLLVVFAASFFGAFELQLPTKWVNAMDSRAEKTGGLLSIFFMAFTLVLVSFSCTGPIIGTLLVEAVSRGPLAPLIGMLGFALALAIPFTIFAIFPSWLSSMPKSGGWLNTVKVVLGFLELAFALKFLSVADLTSHWGILPRETFLVLWIIIFALLGIYLLGKLKLPHDSDMPHVSVLRLFMAMISLAFALYMVPGLWGAPLRAISAFSPPITTQDFNLSNKEVHAAYDDFEIAAEYARKTGKPLMVDFTGFGCVNCRKMENAVWTDAGVGKMLKEDYVLVSLWVDDRKELPKDMQYTTTFAGMEKKVITVGNKWSDFQARYFKSNSQPMYVLLDNKGRLLMKPRFYNENLEEYTKWLNDGLKEYKKRTEE
jgi:thiol:disulfide interchange protein DsbD